MSSVDESTREDAEQTRLAAELAVLEFLWFGESLAGHEPDDYEGVSR